jgi:hypothetical protein
VEGAHGEVIELDTQAPSGNSDQVHEGWLRAVEAIAGRLAHIADRTLRHAQAAPAALETPSAAPSRTPNSLPTPVDSVGEEQVHRVLEAAERIFVLRRGVRGVPDGDPRGGVCRLPRGGPRLERGLRAPVMWGEAVYGAVSVLKPSSLMPEDLALPVAAITAAAERLTRLVSGESDAYPVAG